MTQLSSLALYLALGTAGGLLGSRLHIPGSTMMGATLAVVLFKAIAVRPWPLPKSYALFVQILIGVLVGASYTSEVGRALTKVLVPIVTSTLVVVAAGALTALVLVKTGVLDATTAYLGTSPGAMSALVSIAADSDADPPIVLAFHFFRVLFIIFTAPFVFQLLRFWFPEVPMK